MLPNEFLQRLEKITIWRRGDRRAPHKPLLLLLALGRVRAGQPRLFPFAAWHRDLERLLREFGPPGSPEKNTHEPFRRLPKDGIWEVPGVSPQELGARSRRNLLESGTRGGFNREAFDLLAASPELIEDAAQRLLKAHFPPSLFEDIRDATGLGLVWAVAETPQPASGATGAPRDPRFREDVLREYERRCAVCDYDVRIGDALFGLEAAHIQWHAARGPDVVPNGVALCTLHHKAFDRGAIGLERSAGGRFRVLVSRHVNGLSPAVRLLLDYQGRRIRPPQTRELGPAPEFVDWHFGQVFQGPARV